MKSPFIPVIVPALVAGVVGYVVGKKSSRGKTRLRVVKSEPELLAERELFFVGTAGDTAGDAPFEIPCKVDSDPVDRASWESFPASDSPAW